MNPILTHTEKKDGIIYKGEVFEDNILPISSTPIHSCIRITEEDGYEYEKMLFQEALTKEQLEGQIKLVIEHWKKPTK